MCTKYFEILSVVWEKQHCPDLEAIKFFKLTLIANKQTKFLTCTWNRDRYMMDQEIDVKFFVDISSWGSESKKVFFIFIFIFT